MQFHALSFSSLLFFSACISLHGSLAVGSLQVVETITVDKTGNYGNFKTIQAAVNSVPDWNYKWIRIHVHQGVYMFISSFHHQLKTFQVFYDTHYFF